MLLLHVLGAFAHHKAVRQKALLRGLLYVFHSCHQQFHRSLSHFRPRLGNACNAGKKHAGYGCVVKADNAQALFSSTAILAAPTATASETQNSALGMGSMPKTFCAAAIPLR